MKIPAGFREISHTADWQLEAWAPDLSGLLEQAAAGMYALAGIRLQPGPRIQRSLRIERSDPERLLVAFLRELLYLSERERLAFDQLNLHQDENTLEADLFGGLIANQDKEIKAVTYHNLVIRSDEQGLSVNIVFDV